MSLNPNTLPDMDRRDLEGDITPDDVTRFACPCGDSQCIGYADDPQNIKIGPTFYAADCVMANHHPLVVASREMDDVFNRTRR